MQAGGERESIAQVAQDEPSPLYRLSARRSQMCLGAWSTWNGRRGMEWHGLSGFFFLHDA